MKKILKIAMSVFLLICLFINISGCRNESKSEDENVIKIGSNRAIGTITPYLAEKIGYFEGKDYKIEVVEFADGSTLMEAMAAGELDMGIVGVSPVATWHEKGLDVRVVASANSGGHVILSTTERGIDSVDDLKRKKMAAPNPGTVTDTILKAYILPKYSITENDIVLLTGMKGADMVTTLVSTNEVDAIMTWEPFASMAELQYDNITVVCDASEEWKKSTGSEELYPVNVVAANGEFCDNKSEILTDVLKVIRDTVEYVENNPEEAYELMSQILDLDTEIIRKASNRSKLTFEVNQEATLKTLEWACQLGYINHVPEADELFDLKYMP